MCLRGAKVLFVPAAFNMTTGPAHWELLFRQRAVDNQCFTVGVSPARDERASYVAYGNSMAVDPWGTVLCRAGAEETTLVRGPGSRTVWRRCAAAAHPLRPADGSLRGAGALKDRAAMNGQVFSRFYARGPADPCRGRQPPTARSPGWRGCPAVPGWWDTPWHACQDPRFPAIGWWTAWAAPRPPSTPLPPAPSGRCWKRKAFLSARTARWIWIDACGTAAHPHEGVLHHIAAESQKSAGDEKSPALFLSFNIRNPQMPGRCGWICTKRTPPCAGGPPGRPGALPGPGTH